MKNFKKDGFLILFMISIIATLGSLFYSEVKGFIPCTYCWYQRILMYPLVIITAVSYVTNNVKNYLLTAILSGLGACIAFYHYLLQKVPALSESGSACGLVPCNGIYVNYLGFITIPFMSLIAFTLIFIISLILYKKNKNQGAE